MVKLTICTYFVAEYISHGIKILLMVLSFIAIFNVKYHFQIIWVGLLRIGKLNPHN